MTDRPILLLRFKFNIYYIIIDCATCVFIRDFMLNKFARVLDLSKFLSVITLLICTRITRIILQKFISDTSLDYSYVEKLVN